MGVLGDNKANSKRKSLRSKVVTKKIAPKSARNGNSSAASATMKPLSDIKEYLYKQNAKNKDETSIEKRKSLVDQTSAMITLKNGEKVPLKSLSKSFKKRFNKKLRFNQENKLMSLEKITDELVNIKKDNVFSNTENGDVFNSNPFDNNSESNNNNHQPKLNTKKGNKLIHIKEADNFKKILPSLTNNNSSQEKSNTFQNIKEIIKLRNQNGF